MKKYINYCFQLKTAFILWTIFILGFSVYGKSLFNGFVADDNVYIVTNPFIHTFNPLGFFLGSSYYSGDISQLSGIYYKPIFTLITSLLFTLSQGTPFLMHLVQLLLHLINVILLFYLFKHFFSKQIAFFLSLLFLVHPGNTESVVYIADLQDVLFTTFGLLAFLLSFNHNVSVKKSILIGLLLLLSLLSKESGILFLITILPLCFFFNRNNFTLFSAISMSTFFIYLFLRFAIAHVYINKHIIAPIMAASFETRLLTIPKIIFSYLTLFFFPIKLSWGQHWLVEKITFYEFILPIFIIFIFIIVFIFVYKHHSKKDTFGLLFFCSIIIIGLGLHLQFIPLDFTFAERWFYFPMIGFTGIVGYTLKLITNNVPNKIFIFFAFLLLLILSIRTEIRTLDWKDDFTLASHDSVVDNKSFALENNLGYELIMRNDFQKAIPHLEKALLLYPDQTSMNNLAMAYAKVGQKEKSLQLYKHALAKGNFYLTDENYIAELIRQNKLQTASKQIEISLSKFPNNPKLWLLKSLIEYNSEKFEIAKTSAQHANILSPGIANKILLKMQKKEIITL